MFGRGTRELMEWLPDLQELDHDAVRRLLSRAWLEVAERRELGAPGTSGQESAAELRRLATALQVHAVVIADLDPQVRTACAFVAAEALDIARELVRATDSDPFWREPFVVGLLYLTSGYDANAGVAVRDATPPPDVSDEETYALASVAALLTGVASPEVPEISVPSPYLHERVRGALWHELGSLIAGFNDWLRDPTRASADEIAAALGLADGLRLTAHDLPIALHAEIQHVARLASTAMIAAAGRALRGVPAPEPAMETYANFLRSRCRRQPILWPAAREYAALALPGLTRNAVVAVPTGAGKSGVADLAIQHAVGRGWVLYLAPTNALVGQVRRQLRSDHPGVPIREFLGGSEYTTASGEALQDIAVGQVLVMTPEKCSLALRQSPEAFVDLALTISTRPTYSATGGVEALSASSSSRRPSRGCPRPLSCSCRHSSPIPRPCATGWPPCTRARQSSSASPGVRPERSERWLESTDPLRLPPPRRPRTDLPGCLRIDATLGLTLR